VGESAQRGVGVCFGRNGAIKGADMAEHVTVDGRQFWVEQTGQGPDVLLICGLGDTLEVWQAQLEDLADRYRLTTFDNRGTGRTPMPDEPLTVAALADDAAALLHALEIPQAHVAGYSGGSSIGQELALRHPDAVRSLVLQSTWAEFDPYFRTWARLVRFLMEAAPSERDFLEFFYLDIYTARAHNDGTVARLIDEVLAFPVEQAPEHIFAYLDAFSAHEPGDRLSGIAAPTLVLSGGLDPAARPELGRAVADLIPGARFEVIEGQSHQPFQEVPEKWNALVGAFWRDLEPAGR